MRRAAVALVHHPVLGRRGERLTTTITNLDLHDLSRCVRAYGLEALYAVHPYGSQRLLAERIRSHWVHGAGGKRIPDRGVALERLRIVADLEAVRAELGSDVELWTTAASARGRVTSFAAARAELARPGPAVLLIFGTGWGLCEEVHEAAAHRLEPIAARADTGYNHLSVRAACAIALDRLFG